MIFLRFLVENEESIYLVLVILWTNFIDPIREEEYIFVHLYLILILSKMWKHFQIDSSLKKNQPKSPRIDLLNYFQLFYRKRKGIIEVIPIFSFYRLVTGGVRS